MATVRRLREGLQKYGRHNPNCYWMDDQCHCGLGALLDSLAPHTDTDPHP